MSRTILSLQRRTVVSGSRSTLRAMILEAFDRIQDGTIINVLMELAPQKRSLNENRYYWKVVCSLYAAHLTEATGKPYTGEQAHDFLRAALLTTWLDNPLTGESREVLASTAVLTVAEMEQYLERCRQYLWENFSLYVPLPNEPPPTT